MRIMLFPIGQKTNCSEFFDLRAAQMVCELINQHTPVEQRRVFGEIISSGTKRSDWRKTSRDVDHTKVCLYIENVGITDDAVMGDVTPFGPRSQVLQDLIDKQLPVEIAMRATTCHRGPISLVCSLIAFDLVIRD